MTYIGASDMLLYHVCICIAKCKADINLDAIDNYWNSSYFHSFFVLDTNCKHVTLVELQTSC